LHLFENVKIFAGIYFSLLKFVVLTENLFICMNIWAHWLHTTGVHFAC
jgi:hypothetical protein